MKFLLLFPLVHAGVLALHDGPCICMSSPVVALEAGRSVVSADVEDALDRRCGATLQFDNPDFLPVSYAFEAIPCSGRRVASFVAMRGITANVLSRHDRRRPRRPPPATGECRPDWVRVGVGGDTEYAGDNRAVVDDVCLDGADAGDADDDRLSRRVEQRTWLEQRSAPESDGAPPTGAMLSGSGSLASATSSTGLQASPTASHTSTRTGQAPAGASTPSAGAPLDGQTTPGAQASVPPAASSSSSSLFQVSMASKVVPSTGLTVVATVVSTLVSTMTVVQTVTASCSARTVLRSYLPPDCITVFGFLVLSCPSSREDGWKAGGRVESGSPAHFLALLALLLFPLLAFPSTWLICRRSGRPTARETLAVSVRLASNFFVLRDLRDAETILRGAEPRSSSHPGHMPIVTR
ncbi:hypothetical protein BN1708_013256 [Verticillium longisporum]|uniref:Uncharacterized protein n=1 Tax=Verticillium longisporum TaxID=100787 RepID=A0A0G4LJ04_VERLO|nr:hypothetical protein BN1708_013256 [Verticillium longisporum]